MNEKLIREIGRSQRLEILTALKRHGGMSVKELAAHFQMSYMGIKQHCLDLETEGYLETSRRPKPVGRPEIVYRLTPRAYELFPGGSNEWTMAVLDSVQQSYGPAAPAKLLFTIFGQRADKYRASLDAGLPLPERAAQFAQLRNAEGYMAEFENDDAPPPSPPPSHFAGVPASLAEEQPALPLEVAAPPAKRQPSLAGGFRVVIARPAPVEPSQNGAPSALRIVEHHSPIEDLLRRHPIIGRLERETFERVLNCPVRREEYAEPGLYRCVFHLGHATARP
jgi:predicted ArsR family transcriptional regulator